MSVLESRLKNAVGPDRVSTRETDRVAYARDLWPRGLIRTKAGDHAPHPPEFIVWPGTEDEVADVLTACAEAGVPVVPYGAGSGVCGGTWPIHGGVIVDLKRLRRFDPVDAASGTVRVGAGVIGQHFEEELNRQGFTMGHFPSSIYCSTVGGWIAARSAGQFSSRYGKIEDMVVSLRCVLPDGRRLELSGEHDGPDWRQVVVGSEGTLAVVTEATLKVVRLPQQRLLSGWRFPDVPSGVDAMRRIMQAGCRPCVVRLYDEFDTRMALSGAQHASDADGTERTGLMASLVPDSIGKWAERMKLKAIALGLGQPSLLNTLAGWVPGGCLLILGFEGEAGLAAAEDATARDILATLDAEDLGPGPGLHWFEKRYAVSYKQPPAFAAGAWVDTMEVATTWSRLVGLYDDVRAAVGPHAFIMAHFSHAYVDGCSIYFTFVGAAPDATRALETYDATWSDGLQAVAAAGATISHHHGVGLSKIRGMVDEQGEGGRTLFDAAKAAFDPRRIMNPGKLWSSPEAAFSASPPLPSLPKSGDVEIDATSLIARLSPATTTDDLVRAAREAGLDAGPWPPQTTVGHVLTTAEARAPSEQYGAPRDRVVAVVAELENGSMLATAEAPRKATGPDYVRMAVGGAGRLGRLRSVTLRLWPRPPAVWSATASFRTPAAAQSAAQHVRNLGLLSVESRCSGSEWSIELAGDERIVAAGRDLVVRTTRERDGHIRPGPTTPPPPPAGRTHGETTDLLDAAIRSLSA